jgi:hypothetical protein
VMEKSKRMFEYEGSRYHGESHISKCQSMLNHEDKVTWIRSGVLIL